jgi:hypothetical protein
LSGNKFTTRLPFGLNSGYIDSEEDRDKQPWPVVASLFDSGSRSRGSLASPQAAVSSKIFSFPGFLLAQDFDETRRSLQTKVIAFFTFRTVCPVFPDKPRQENMRTRTRRSQGYIVHIGESRSAGFWAIVKSRDDGKLHFAYGKSFLSSAVPKIGHEVEFTRLHPADRGDLDRAIGVAIVKSCRKSGAIQVEHASGLTRLVQRSRTRCGAGRAFSFVSTPAEM